MDEDLTSLDPHVVKKTAEETDGEFVRFESTIHPALNADEIETTLSHKRWGIDFPSQHLHPKQKERIAIVSGTLQVSIEGDERTLTEGEEITIPPNTTHRHWNATSHPVRVVWERHPPFRTKEWAESAYVIAQAGHADEEGTPHWLQLAVLVDEYPDESAYLPVLPVGIQKLLFSLLAPIGSLVGYEATHSRNDSATPQ